MAGGQWTVGGRWGRGINSLSKTELNCDDVDGTRGLEVLGGSIKGRGHGRGPPTPGLESEPWCLLWSYL